MALKEPLGQYALRDSYLRVKIIEIIKRYGIDTIVETGMHRGQSTAIFSLMVPKVYGIDILPESIRHAKNYVVNTCNRDNVTFICGNSPDVLKELMPTLNVDKTLFFLDAHWWDDWPINDEIASIEKNKGIIVVHDILVPDHPELNYDVYKGQPFTYEFIQKSLSDWSPDHKIEYNTVSFSQCRGVGFIYSSKKPTLHFNRIINSTIEIL